MDVPHLSTYVTGADRAKEINVRFSWACVHLPPPPPSLLSCLSLGGPVGVLSNPILARNQKPVPRKGRKETSIPRPVTNAAWQPLLLSWKGRTNNPGSPPPGSSPGCPKPLKESWTLTVRMPVSSHARTHTHSFQDTPFISFSFYQILWKTCFFLSLAASLPASPPEQPPTLLELLLS